MKHNSKIVAAILIAMIFYSPLIAFRYGMWIALKIRATQVYLMEHERRDKIMKQNGGHMPLGTRYNEWKSIQEKDIMPKEYHAWPDPKQKNYY